MTSPAKPRPAAEILTAAERVRGLSGLFGEWLADESGYDEETLPILKRLIDEDRAGGRKLFSA